MNNKNRNFLFRLFVGLFIFVIASTLAVPSVYASPASSYYDWGSYYNSTGKQVLGVSFSSLEKLPTPEIPKNIMPSKAQGILPGNPFYNLEILTENIQLALTLDPIQKETQRLAFASERLSEIKTLADQGKPDLANDAAVIYKNTMEDISQNVEELSSKKTPGSETLLTKVENTTASHAVLAQSLALSSPPNAESFWTKVVTATENTMDTMADVSNQPAIPEDLSAGIQKLKEQGLITPEESDKLYSLPNRTDVRNELDKLVDGGQFPAAEALKLNSIVALNYPQNYKDTQAVIGFSELRTYQALTPPTDEVQSKIDQWQNQSGDVPAPGEIRPYLYYARAQELAKNIDFSGFDPQQQSEAARFYPDAVVQNPTFEGAPVTPSPSPSTSPIPTPSVQPANAPTAENYLTDYKGPLPGTFGYFFKNIGEQAALVTSFDPARRLELEMDYADERLQEAHALSQQKGKEKLYTETLSRYQTAMNNASDNIKSFKGPEEEKRDLARSLESESARHNVAFEKGIIPPPATGDTKIYATALNATENVMDATSDVLGRPVLPLALVDRLQDLKAQGIVLQEEVSDLTNAKSREEVREKIRNLVKVGGFPPADAKKLDEAQSLTAPSDFNQLVEVRKIEELQNLRAVQAEFAQTATLKEVKDSYEQRVSTLYNTIDPALISVEDLAGREDLIKTYKDISAKAPKRPINGGQFGPDVIPGAPLPKPPVSSDVAFETCPIGALLNQFEGCVWENNGKRINEYPQYKCDKPAQYWSFVSNACVPMDLESPGAQDSVPSCPIGYVWNWNASSCRKSTGGGSILPIPQPEPSPTKGKEGELSKFCPTGATYKAPKGCVWDANDKPVYDEAQYRCTAGNTYYSFSQNKCVPNPDPKKPFPDDAKPDCKEKDMFWNWSEGKCVAEPKPQKNSSGKETDIFIPKPSFVSSDNPFYFLKQGVEAIQTVTAFGSQAQEEVKLAHAKERFAEAYNLLEKNNEKGFEGALAKYTGAMQSIYNDLDKGVSLNEEDKKELGEKLAQEVTEQNLLLQKVSILAGKDAVAPISAVTSVITQGIDRASDLQGKAPIPENIKEKLDSLPEDMLTKEQKEKLAKADTRLEARLITGELVATGALTQGDLAVLNNWMAPEDPGSVFRLNELKKLSQAVELTNLKEDIAEKVEKTEDVAKKLDDFKKTFTPGEDIPADLRPYMRLTRIDEISQTIRPDVVRLEDYGNRKDLQLAVATLQQEFKPTNQDFQRLAEYRRSSPGRSLPPELARIEALSYSIGVRDSAAACFLPSPPFAPNTPCPSSGAAIPISSYYNGAPAFPGFGSGNNAGPYSYGAPQTPVPSVDKDGKPLVYGKGPEAAKAGVCPDGYHWMYDNGGWCMSNSGSYSYSSGPSGSTYQSPYSSGPGYTPYTSYYSAPGAPPQGYAGGYAAPVYYGSAPTTYNTAPAPGTVPGTGPAPTSPGTCPSGFHWMPPSGGQAGWCMADGGTYVGGGYSGSPTYSYPNYSATPTSGGYNCGSQSWDPVRQKCADGACPGGYSWDGSKCVPFTSPGYSSPSYPGGAGSSSYNYYSPNINQSSCGPGYYWNGNGCVRTSPSDTYGSCSGLSCGGGSYLDYSSCSCKYPSYYGGSTSGSSGTSYTGSCSPPSGGCGSGWFDSSSCSCKQASSSGCYNVSASSCPSGWYFDSSVCTCRQSSSTSGTGTSGSTGSCPSGSHWMSDNGGYCMSDNTPSGGSTTSSGGTSSGSCPSGYHWMSDNGGWCMSDAARDSGSSGGTTTTSTPTTSTPPPTTTTTTTSEPAPAPSTPTTTTTTSEPAPAPASSEPAPAPSTP